MLLPYRLKRLEAVHSGHDDIEKDGVRRRSVFFAERGKEFFSSAKDAHLVAGAFKLDSIQVEEEFIIVDQSPGDESYSLASSALLSKRDIPFVEKLYASYKNYDLQKLREIFALERDTFEIEIERFLKNKVDLKVIIQDCL